MEGRLRQISSPYGVGGETGSTAPEDLKSIDGYRVGEGKDDKGLVFCSCIPKRPSEVFPALSSLGHHRKWTGRSTTKHLDQSERIKTSLRENKTKTGKKLHRPHRSPSEKHKREVSRGEKPGKKQVYHLGVPVLFSEGLHHSWEVLRHTAGSDANSLLPKLT